MKLEFLTMALKQDSYLCAGIIFVAFVVCGCIAYFYYESPG